jgi:hypothetical protein
MQFGFELEFFLTHKKIPVLIPSALRQHADESGWLVEARGKPRSCAIEAAFSLQAAIHKLRNELKIKGHRLTLKAVERVTFEVVTQARKTFVKGRNLYRNMYGLDLPPIRHEENGDIWAKAGLHIHFSNYYEIQDEKQCTHKVHKCLDMTEIIRLLDAEFANEIKTTERVPGMYEFKNHGFEYRSLPATINILEVAEFLRSKKHRFTF